MKIYIVRHAIAEAHGTPGMSDNERPLTAEGIDKMTKAAKGIAKIIEPPPLILTSPLERAHHTAKIMAAALKCEDRIQLEDALMPDVATQALTRKLAAHKKLMAIMVVGHEPSLSALAATLLDCSPNVLDIKKGSLMGIEVDTLPFREPGRLLFFLTPKQLRHIAK